jgi:hypothetical protein
MSRLQVDASRMRKVVLVREDRACPQCGATMRIRCCRTRSIQTLQGPVRLIVKLVQCHNEQCQQARTFAPEQECQYAMPRWGIGWDVFCWMGQRRFSRHWSVTQVRLELADSYNIRLSDDAIEDHLASYQNMVAARQQDLEQMRAAYGHTREIVLTIDGLQPEKGHETLYLVREVTRQRAWFAEALLSGATHEIRKLFVRAKQLAAQLDLTVVLWISDKQDAFLKCVAQEFPGVRRRYCQNHFFRDLAKPALDLDSTAKTKMRGKIRGLRALERQVLQAQQADLGAAAAAPEDPSQTSVLAGESGQVVLDYCSVVRGILNDNHGGPRHPAGVRMVEALGDVQASLDRVACSERTGPAFVLLERLKGFMDRGVANQQEAFARVRAYTDHVCQVMDLLTDPDGLALAARQSQFVAKIEAFQQFPDDAVYSHFAKTMVSFQPGLFAGADLTCHPHDNLDLERWFRSPKSHERRIHGHRHAGTRIVREGATLALTLDAHLRHPGVFTREDLFPFRTASAPPSQLASQQRHRIMRKARSKKTTNFT